MKNLLKWFAMVTILATTATSVIYGQDFKSMIQEGIKKIDDAYCSYSISDMIGARGLFERLLTMEPENLYMLYYKTLAEYRLITMDRSNDINALDSYYDAAVANCALLSNDPQLSSEAKTLQAAIHMMKLASSPMSGMTLTPKINSLLQEAIKINPNNSRTYLIDGMMAFNMPAMFGGSIEKAAEKFIKSDSLYSTTNEIETIDPDWGHAEVLAWLGRSFEKREDFDNAKIAYEKALKISPDFSWVSHVLLPQLNNLIAEKKK